MSEVVAADIEKTDPMLSEALRLGAVLVAENATGDVEGLSSPHIFPPKEGGGLSILPPEREPETRKPDRAGYAEFWDGGSLATVKRVSAGGRRRPWVGGKRSTITQFTWASRRRLMRTVAKLRRDTLPLFCTLTYPDRFPRDPLKWKRDLRAFWMRVSRKYPMAGFVWRLEGAERKSGSNVGEAAPHFHLLLYGIPDHPGLKKWVSRSWYEVVGSGDEKHLRAGTQVAKVRNHRGVMAYASKVMGVEMAKLTQTEFEGVGRWWGCYGRHNLPWAVRVWFPIADGDAVKYIRWFRRFARLKFTRSYKSLTVFCDGSFWAGKIRAGPGPPGDFRTWSRQFA